MLLKPTFGILQKFKKKIKKKKNKFLFYLIAKEEDNKTQNI